MNLNYLFYHKYFDFFADSLAPGPKEMNEAIQKATVKEVEREYIFPQTFYMKTTYPGLLIGTGNPHDAARESQDKIEKDRIQDAVKMGFTLDYVTGLPTIPGSTVKGILRSAFSQYPEYVIEKLLDVTKDSKWIKVSEKTLKKIENCIFGDAAETNVSMQDIFFGAVPVKAGRGNHILGEDFVTSHKGKKEELDGLVEPNPVRMLKVIPNVIFEFRFQCQDTIVDEYVLSWDVKKLLFAGILEDLGIGAKTNTGYGNMIYVDSMEENSKILEIDKVEISKKIESENKNGWNKGKQNQQYKSGQKSYSQRNTNQKNYDRNQKKENKRW